MSHDFHMNGNFVKSQERLEKLVQALETAQITVDILVFSGDLIHAAVISHEAQEYMKQKYPALFHSGITNEEFLQILKDKKTPDTILDDYNQFLTAETEKTFAKATKIFEKFIKDLNITDSKNIIVCCGNHDRMRKISKTPYPFDCNTLKEEDFAEDFKFYNKFCEALKVKMHHTTGIYRVKDINFLCINTNWKIPQNNETNKMCISCKTINQLLNAPSGGLSKNKSNNILISHKPFDDFCEDAKFDYTKDYSGTTLKEQLRERFGTFLFGDKHTYEASIALEQNEFLCGSPLYGDTITYNLIDFIPGKGVTASRFVRWNNYEWTITPVKHNLKEIYEISTDHIKPISFKLLTNTEDKIVSPEDVISNINAAVGNGRLKLISKLFSSCCKCKEQVDQLKKDNKKVPVDEENMFDWITSIILNPDSSNHHPLNIRGECSVGKSAFLGLEYLYLLYLYGEGRSNYIPFYFNMKHIISSNANSKAFNTSPDCNKIYEKCCKEFDRFFKKSIAIKNKLRNPICFLIDGLDQTDFLLSQKETVEKYICHKLDEEINAKHKYVLAFNGYQFSKKMETLENYYSPYVIHFNMVQVVKNGARSYRFKTMITSYAKLSEDMSDTECEKLMDNILKYRKISISLNFLHTNFRLLSNIEENDPSWNVMTSYKDILSERVKKWFSSQATIKIAEKVAFLIQQKSITFYDLCNMPEINGKLGYNTFCIIKSKPDIRRYLIASHYVSELQHYSSNETPIDEDSALYYFIPRDIAVMIRLVLAQKTNIIERFVKRHHKELTGYLYSTIVYLAGHSKSEHENNLIAEIRSYKDKRPRKETFLLCNKRSFALADIICSDRKEASFEYIYSLMDNKEDRWFNRNYQLYYYEDNRISAPVEKREIESKDSIQNGFDFHNTFLVLSAKLEYSYKRKERYPLMEVDLFTLCDLLYSRLQSVETSGMDKKLSFFYSKNYNRRGDSKALATIDSIVALLNEYLDHRVRYNSSLHESNRIFVYFSMMRKTFIHVREQIIKNTDCDVRTPYVNPVNQLENIFKIKDMRRIGWNIESNETLSQEKLEEWISRTDEVRETISEHILESVYIAMLFLPDKWTYKKGEYQGEYSKDKIISLLLTRELGKYATFDYPPFYSGHLKLKNQEEMARSELLLLGAMDGAADLKTLFELFDAESKSNSNSGDINLIW